MGDQEPMSSKPEDLKQEDEHGEEANPSGDATSEDISKVKPTSDKPTSSNSKRKAEWFDLDDEKNTYVYVKGLPTTITEEEFVDYMKIAGVIANVKLYRNKDGSLKGDALCRYVRRESVDQALLLIDGRAYDDEHSIQCERAKFELKGSYDPTKKPRVDPRAKLKQKKVADKILSWEPSKAELELRQKKVILKHMFVPEQLNEDASLMIDLKDDVESHCTNLIAAPKRVDIYDKHPDGVIAVTFAESDQAIRCVEALNNEFFDERVITAELWDGETNYKIKETDEESEKRLEKFKDSLIKE